MSRWTTETGPSAAFLTDGATDVDLVAGHPFGSTTTKKRPTQTPKTIIITGAAAYPATIVFFLDAAQTVTDSWEVPSAPMEIPIDAYYIDASASDTGISGNAIYGKAVL